MTLPDVPLRCAVEGIASSLRRLAPRNDSAGDGERGEDGRGMPRPYHAPVARFSPPVFPRTPGERMISLELIVREPCIPRTRGGTVSSWVISGGWGMYPLGRGERKIRTGSKDSRIRTARACRGASVGQSRGLPLLCSEQPCYVHYLRLSLLGAAEGQLPLALRLQVVIARSAVRHDVAIPRE